MISPFWPRNWSIACLILFSAVAFAGPPEPSDARKSILTLTGVDAQTKTPCSLFVYEVGYTGPEQSLDQFFVQASTDMSHDGDQPETFTLRSYPNINSALVGRGANVNDQLFVFISPNLTDLRGATSFNLRWQHGDHVHTTRCLKLVVNDTP